MLQHHLTPDDDLASRTHAFIDASVAWLRERLGLGAGSRVLDLGCGPGLYAHRLARAGVEVLGIDVSRRSLEHARTVAEREGLPARFRRAATWRSTSAAGTTPRSSSTRTTARSHRLSATSCWSGAARRWDRAGGWSST